MHEEGPKSKVSENLANHQSKMQELERIMKKSGLVKKIGNIKN